MMIRMRNLFTAGGRFRRDTQGAAAVEFALLLPIFLLIYVCVVEFCQAFMVQRRVSHATSQVADIVAQSGQVDRARLNGYFDIAEQIMAPFADSPMQSRVSSVGLNSRGQTVVQWSHARCASACPSGGLIALAPGALVTLPPDLVTQNGDSVILSESVYAYDSPYDIAVPGFPNYLAGLTTFRRSFYLRPREVVAVSCLDCPTR